MYGELLEKRRDKTVPTHFLLTLLRLVLLNNIVEFNNKIYQQVWGVSMGSKCSPGLADIFMAGFESSFLNGIPARLKEKMTFFKRFLDDIFIIWSGSQTEFEEFFALLDNHHRNIKFTCEPDFENQTATFLDVNVSLANGVTRTDLFVTPTSANEYQ